MINTAEIFKNALLTGMYQGWMMLKPYAILALYSVIGIFMLKIFIIWTSYILGIIGGESSTQAKKHARGIGKFIDFISAFKDISDYL